MRGRPVNTPERIAALLARRTRRTPSGCLVWTGPLNKDGYASISSFDVVYRAHRLVYELARGEIPEGHDLDHTCHTADSECVTGPACPHRACLNVEHLEPVTRAENNRRGGARRTACINGHPFDEANTFTGSGYRRCRTCNREAARRSKERRLAREAAS